MQLNADFEKVIVLNSHNHPWQATGDEGVEKCLLECVGFEVVRLTEILRCAAGTEFSLLSSSAGSEVIVLDGQFSDAYGEYGAGTYIKNMPFNPQPAVSRNGCVLFVKQGHLSVDDNEHIMVDARQSQWRHGLVSGLSVMPLADFKGEHSALVRWEPGTVFNAHRHWGGEEIYVLEGVFEDEFGRYQQGSWMRNPHLSQHAPFSREGCTIFVKVGHLPASKI